MTNDLVATAWAPGLIGLCVSSSMYGVSLAQFMHYLWFFPHDPSSIKLLVFLVFVADGFHMVGVTEFYWTMVVLCHRSDAVSCVTDLSWGPLVALPMNYVVTFAVQCFYCQRVWIITDSRIDITMIIFLMAVLQFMLGIWVSIENIMHGTLKYLYTTPLVPIGAGVSTLCDIIITVTIFKHLWRSEFRDRSNVIRDLVVVFINMGALTCLISVIVGVVYVAQGGHYLVGAPAVVISRCYVNSLFAVLNARRSIREREARRLHYAIELPSLPTIT